MSGVPVPIAAPGFRDELKGSGLGLGLTPRTHPIGMLALSACRYMYFPVYCSAELHVNPHHGTPVPAVTKGSRSTLCRTRRLELKGVVDAWRTPFQAHMSPQREDSATESALEDT